ncbi:MAG: hypothetical protein IKU34_03535 [Clostridia bacterium]|nr:hypothetical protein [Clostridia bacterium]
MNRRLSSSLPHGQKTGKNSFLTPNDDSLRIRQSIEESLYTVRFNAHDMHAVMRAVKTGRKAAPSRKKRRMIRADLVFTLSFMIMIALPLTLYVIRSKENLTTIVLNNNPVTVSPQPASQLSSNTTHAGQGVEPTAQPEHEQLTSASPDLAHSEAVRIARECFETQCDTTIFTFEEYTVTTTYNDQRDQYAVSLESIYDNGCSFTVILSGETGSVIQYSSPKLATVPTRINNDSPEIGAWFDQHGKLLITWPQDVQAEFSRRYQGATIRAAKGGELTAEAAIATVRVPIESNAPGVFSAYYCALYSERASGSARAAYQVYCYAQEITDILPDEEPLVVTLDAQTGAILSYSGNLPESDLDLAAVFHMR